MPIDAGEQEQHLVALAQAVAHAFRTGVAPGYDRGGELIIDRCLTRGDLALHSMWVDTSHLPYSDHRALGGRIAIVGNGQREHDHRV